jgi:hypothetical protein
MCYLAGRTLADLRSYSWPPFVEAGLLLAGAWVVLSFASSGVQLRQGSHPNVAGALHWLSVSSAGLVLIVVLGAIPSLAGPRDLAPVLGEDVGLVLVVATLLWAIGPSVGAAGSTLLQWMERHGDQSGPQRRFSHLAASYAEEWRPPTRAPDARLSPLWSLYARCLVVVAAGLALSVGEQAVGSVGNPLPGHVANFYAPIGGWVVATALAWRLTTPLFPTAGHHPSRYAVHGAGLTLILSVVAVFFVAYGAADRADGLLWNTARVGNLAQPMTIPFTHDGDVATLAQTFSPDLRFDPKERWLPTSVHWYVAQNDPKQPFRNTTDCVDGCYSLSCDDAKGSCAPSGTDALTVYWDDSTGGAPTGAAWPDTSRPTALQNGWLLLHYWFFYNYDSLGTPLLTQWHQADWEQVTVALSRTDDSVSPKFVAFSEHCAGVVLPWKLVEVGDGGTHLLDFVARGSHANYPRPVDAPLRQLNCSLDLNPPRYLGLGSVFFSSALSGDALEVPVGYVAGLRDHTGNMKEQPYELVELQANDDIESFLGFWGRDNNLKFWQRPATKAGGGPASPPEQGAERAPGEKMLCSTRWFSRSRPKCDVTLPPIAKE